MDVSEAQPLRALERENAALKRLVGDLTLDHRLLKDVLGKQWGAWLPSAVRRLRWSRRTGGANGAPAGGCPGLAVPSVGRQGNRSGRRWSPVFLPSRSALHGLGSARCSPC